MATRRVRVRAIKRPEVDEDKLAIAFLMLAKVLYDQEQAAASQPSGEVDGATSGAEAA